MRHHELTAALFRGDVVQNRAHFLNRICDDRIIRQPLFGLREQLPS